MADPTPQQVAAWQAQLNVLQAAINIGAEEVDYPQLGRTKYRSLDEMKAIRNDLQAAIDAATAVGGAVVKRRTRRIVPIVKSGW